MLDAAAFDKVTVISTRIVISNTAALGSAAAVDDVAAY